MSDLENFKKEFKVKKDVFKEKLTKMKAEVAEEAEKMFKEGTKALFDAYEDLKSFSWRQYTCYFNDGDTCYFSVYNDSYSLSVNGKDEEDDYDDEDSTYSLKEDMKKHEGNPVIFAELQKKYVEAETRENKAEELRKIVASMIGVLDEDDYKEMFGDHAEVEVTREGIKITDCSDHD